MSTNPIDKNTVDEYWKYLNLAGTFGSKIEDRIDFIIRRIYQECDQQVDCWYFDDAPEGDVGSLHRALDDSFISSYVVEVDGKGTDAEIIILLNDGTTWCIWDGFPTRWLYEDFEKELVDGIAAYQRQEADRKAAKAAAKAAKKAAKAAAKAAAVAKLSDDELKALGIKK